MEQNKKTVSTSTVIITIIFLSMFIIIPPITRILYKEEVEPIDKVITMTCTKQYNNAALSIVSIATFTGENISTNKITFTNENKLSELDNMTDLFAQSDVTDYFQILGNFSELNDNFITENETSKTIEIDSELVETITDNSSILSHFQEKDLLERYYVDNGFICTEK